MFVHKINDELSLKLIDVMDADHIFKLTNESRGHLRKWLRWVDHTTTEEDTVAFIKGCLQGFADNKSMHTVILFRGEIVGVASYNEINWSNKTAYIGYWLGEKYQGEGIMTSVARALTAHAFNEIKVNKVEIRAAVGNEKSRKVPERLGFVQEGTIRQAERIQDRYVDHVVYGMLANEWSIK